MKGKIRVFFKELFWFKLLGKCPECKLPVKARLSGGWMPSYVCSCGWGR